MRVRSQDQTKVIGMSRVVGHGIGCSRFKLEAHDVKWEGHRRSEATGANQGHARATELSAEFRIKG